MQISIVIVMQISIVILMFPLFSYQILGGQKSLGELLESLPPVWIWKTAFPSD